MDESTCSPRSGAVRNPQLVIGGLNKEELLSAYCKDLADHLGLRMLTQHLPRETRYKPATPLQLTVQA